MITDRFCCENGANNADCCLNGGKGPNCCINNATDVDCTPNYPCGTLLPLTQYVHPDFEQTPGVLAGKWYDETPIYVGAGTFGACAGKNKHSIYDSIT